MERRQFTFYSSFALAAKRIKSKAARCDLYDAIINYALFGIEPNMDELPESVAIAFELCRPNIEASLRKARGGMAGRSAEESERNEQDTDKMAERYSEDGKRYGEDGDNKKKNKGEKKNKIENKIENKNKCNASDEQDDGFESFWAAYPIKSGDIRQAYFEYLGALKTATADEIMAAVTWQAEEKGRFMGSAEKWLRNKGWTEKRQEKPQSANDIRGSKAIDFSAEDLSAEILKAVYDAI